MTSRHHPISDAAYSPLPSSTNNTKSSSSSSSWRRCTRVLLVCLVISMIATYAWWRTRPYISHKLKPPRRCWSYNIDSQLTHVLPSPTLLPADDGTTGTGTGTAAISTLGLTSWDESLLAADDRGHSGTLVAFAYFESKYAPENTAFFIQVGLLPYLNHPHVHFLFILMSDISIDLPRASNVFIHRRRNYGWDVCAWNETMIDPLMTSITARSISSYRYIVWMNASVRGPMFATGTPFATWLPYFIRQINDRDKLIGTSFNCMKEGLSDPTGVDNGHRYGMAHLQSMFLVMDWYVLPEVLKYAICTDSYFHATYKGEIMFTRAVLAAGYGVKSQMLSFLGVNLGVASEANAACDYDAAHNINTRDLTDRFFPDEYFHMNVHPMEMIFFKNTRSVLDPEMWRYSEWIVRAAVRQMEYKPNYRPRVNTSLPWPSLSSPPFVPKP